MNATGASKQVYLEFYGRIHSNFFPREPRDQELEQRFLLAIDTYQVEFAKKKQIDLQYVLKEKLNLEAIELALRVMRVDNNISALFKTYSFLIEVRRPYSIIFENSPRSWLVALFQLSKASIESFLLLILGQWQLRRHHLV
ncbi:MAG: hypothetical protein IPK04_06560 [Bdellovibrionales bacterium]|nr:hypothetical protein [Bdellovibrionales bacterium]